MIMEKRGISPVIASILLIMLVLVAIGIIAAVVVPFVRDNLEESAKCVSYIDYFSFEESINDLKYNCYESINAAGASVRAKIADNETSKKVIGFELVFIRKDGTSESVSVREGVSSVSCNDDGEIKMLKEPCSEELKIPKSGEVRTYVYNPESGNILEKAEVYPVLVGEKICDMTDSIRLITCEDNVNLN